MSEKYEQMIALLTDYFYDRLPLCGVLTLTHDQVKRGVDCFDNDPHFRRHQMLVDGAFIEWLHVHNYELSYNQTCQAYFAALAKRELLTIEE